METLKYEVEFLTDWHCGSGLTAGAESDGVIIKDDLNFPYIPGKTLKGLLSDSIDEICIFTKKDNYSKAKTRLFGVEKDENEIFFSNVVINQAVKDDIENINSFLIRNIASTAILPSGIAKSGSLRALEVCMPIKLEGNISGITNIEKELLIEAMKWTRALGLNRNRGLGRCRISEIK